MLQEIIDAIWLVIWKSHPSYGKFLTVDQAEESDEEMLAELDECIQRHVRTFGDETNQG